MRIHQVGRHEGCSAVTSSVISDSDFSNHGVFLLFKGHFLKALRNFLSRLLTLIGAVQFYVLQLTIEVEVSVKSNVCGLISISSSRTII